jgi:hypothetical protein
MGQKYLRGSDMDRHEENVAKIRGETSNPNLWDIGISDALRAKIPPEHLQTIFKEILDKVPDGVYLLDLRGTKVYASRDSKKQKLELGLRPDFVGLWGEETMAWIDAKIQTKV